MTRGKNRRGATLVLVALSMTVVLGFSAFAVDLSQMAAYRSELQRAADAGAHAGAIQLTKTRYDSAAAIASSFAVANLVFGKAPIVDAIEYGTWDNATSKFTLICSGVACSKASVTGADAIRILVHGSGSTIFAGILGYFGFSIQTKAIGWAAPTVSKSGCVKPFALEYTTLTKTLNAARGLPLTYNPLRYPLEPGDLAIIRDNPTALTVCLKLGSPGNPCTAGQAGTSYPGNFQAVDLNPGDHGAATYENNIAGGCFSAGPGDTLTVETGNMKGPTSAGKDAWCANFGSGPCVMKAALWQVTAPANSTATNGDKCKGGTTGSGWCPVIQMIASFVITDASGSGSSAIIQGYFSNSIDSGPIGTVKGTLQRPVIAQ